MKSAFVSPSPTVARRPQSYPLRLEHLEDRSVPGSVLGASMLDAQLGVMAQAALGPVSELALATTTQETAVLVTPEVSGALLSQAASNDLLYPPAPIQDIQSQAVAATQSQAAGGAQAPSGPALEIQATQTSFTGLNDPQFGPKAFLVGPFTNGDFSLGFSHWIIADPTDGNVSTGSGPFANEAILGTVGQVNIITQLFSSPAFKYRVDLDLANDGGTESQFMVLLDGRLVVNLVNPAPFGPKHFTKTITLPAAPNQILQSSLSIIERQDPAFWEVSNIRVTPA